MRIRNRKRRQVHNVLAVDQHGERLRLEPPPLAVRAGDGGHVALDLLPHPLRVGLFVAPREVVDHALVVGLVGPLAAAMVRVGDRDRLVEAVQDRIEHVGRHLVEWDVGARAQGLQDAFQDPRVPGARGGRARPGIDRPLRDGTGVVRDHEVGVDLHAHAQAGAGRTGPVGRVEGEVARFDLAERDHVVGAGERFRVDPVLRLIRDGDPEQPTAEFECLFHAVRQAALGRFHLFFVVAAGQDHTVHDDVDRVALVLLQADLVVQREDLAIHPYPHKAALARVREDLDVLPFAVLDDRRQQHEPAARLDLPQAVHHLLYRLHGDGLAADGTVRPSRACEEQAQVVVDLGHRAHGGAWIATARLLVDRDCRREAFDVVDVGFVHLAEELAGVGGQGLDVTALALGIDRVECERGLAGAGDSSDHDQLVARDRDVNVLKIVLPRATDNNLVQGHSAAPSRRGGVGRLVSVPSGFIPEQ